MADTELIEKRRAMFAAFGECITKSMTPAEIADRLLAAATPPSPSTAPEVDERAAFEASRPEFEAAMRAAGHRTDRWGDGTYNGRTEYRWEGWVAALASRPAEVDDEELPPLPPRYTELSPFPGRKYFTDEQYRQGQRDAVAADRARRGGKQ